jgi:hypothetical protein
MQGSTPVAPTHVPVCRASSTPSARSASLVSSMRQLSKKNDERPALALRGPLPIAVARRDHGSFGARFWGQVRGFPGRLRVLRGRGATSGEISRIAGKAL